MIFCEDTKKTIFIYTWRYNNKELPKKFWATFVAKTLFENQQKAYDLRGDSPSCDPCLLVICTLYFNCFSQNKLDYLFADF